MSLKEHNRLRIERLTGRFNTRRARAADSKDAWAAFDAGFVRVCDGVLAEVLADVGAELRKAGHDYVVERDAHPNKPSLVFRMKLDGGDARHANAILFFVKHDSATHPSEVIVELSLRGEYELGRFREIGEMTRSALEQMVMDGLEHMIVCNQSELPP